MGFISSTSQSAVCEQYDLLGNEKSGRHFVESLKSYFKRGTNFLTGLATLCIMVEYLLLLEPVVLEQE